MPVVQIKGLPRIVKSTLFYEIKLIMRGALASIKELEITSDQITVEFPQDRYEGDVATEIIINIEKLFVKKGRTAKVKKRISEVACKIMKQYFPLAKVECFTSSFDQRKEGFYCIE